MNLLDNSCSDDGNLVEEVKHGDAGAFKALYYRYFKPLIRFAWYRTRSIETSRDLVQEVFFKVWMRRENLDPGKSFKAYLYKSLNNHIINYRKLRSTNAISLEEAKLGKRKFEEGDIDAEIDFFNALQHLPDKIKAVYVLSRTEGYKYTEIAEICGISVKAVEKRMSKAFELLRKYLRCNNSR